MPGGHREEGWQHGEQERWTMEGQVEGQEDKVGGQVTDGWMVEWRNGELER